MEKQVILLNGPSSAGKSTLSRTLRSVIKDKTNKSFEVVSIDDFMKLVLNTNEKIYEDDVFEISGLMCNKVLESLETNDGVIVDHVITSERIFNEFNNMLNNYDIFSVHVDCPLETLLKRERERGNRCEGTAESSYIYLYPKTGYNLTVDTDKMTSEECALEILKKIDKAI